MAYAAVVQFIPLGPMDFKIVVDETDLGTADTKEIDLTKPQGQSEAQPAHLQIPRKFRLFGVLARRDSGTATTLAPALEKKVAAGDYQDLMGATADGEPSAFSAIPVLVHVEGGALRHQATPDAGSDNVTRTEWICRRGWSDNDYHLDTGEERK